MDAARRSAGSFLGIAVLACLAASTGCASTPGDEFQREAEVRQKAAAAVKETRDRSESAFLADQPAGQPIARPQAPPGTGVVNAGGAVTDTGTTQVKVVALIGSDVVITDDEVWQLVRQRVPEYIRLTGAERDAKEKELFDQELVRLIERELVLADFLAKIKKNKPQVMEELKDEAGRAATRQMRQARTAYQIQTDEEFHKLLKEMGISYKAMFRHMERNYIMQVYLQQFLKDKGKNVSLAQLRAYYDGHPEEFKVEDRVKWMDLFVSYNRFPTAVEARQYAEGLLAKLKGGADFGQVVKEHGHGDSALRGGEGIGSKRGEIVPRELEPEVFKLGAGELSGLIATETGFHVIKVLERDEAGVRPFDEKTQTAIRNKLAAQVQKVEYEKLIDDLWRRTTVRVVDGP